MVLAPEQRARGVFALGKPQSGKTTFLQRTFLDDVIAGHGCAFIDLDGTADELLRHIPPSHRERCLLIDLSDWQYPLAYNPLEGISEHRFGYVATTLLDTFRYMWKDIGWGAQMELYFLAGLLAMLEFKGTLLGLYYVLSSDAFRDIVLSDINDIFLKDYWLRDFETYPKKERRLSLQSSLNKLFSLFADKDIRYFLGQRHSSFNLSDIINQGHVLIFTAPQNWLGTSKAQLVTSILLGGIAAAEHETPFHLFIDNAPLLQNQLPLLLGTKNLSVTFSANSLSEFELPIKQKILGKTGTFVTFQLSPEDFKQLTSEIEIHPLMDVLPEQLEPFHAYVRVGFRTEYCYLPPITARHYPKAPEQIRKRARSFARRSPNFKTPRDLVEREVNNFIRDITKPR